MKAINTYRGHKLSLPFKKWVEQTDTTLDQFIQILNEALRNYSKQSFEWWNKRPLLEIERGLNEIWLNVHGGALLYWDLDCYHNWTQEESDIMEIKERFEEFALLNMNQIEVSYE